VEMQHDVWNVFFDCDDDGLRGKMEEGILAKGARVLEIELYRAEKRWKRDMGMRTADQSINREKELDVDGKEVVNEPGSNACLPVRSNGVSVGVSELTESANGIQEKSTRSAIETK
jgi:hypothetical protein